MKLENMSVEELKRLKEIVDSFIDYSQSAIIKNNFIESFYKYSIADDVRHIQIELWPQLLLQTLS